MILPHAPRVNWESSAFCGASSALTADETPQIARSAVAARGYGGVMSTEITVRGSSSAVQDAVTRAQQYAHALGLGTVVPVAAADAGMLSANLHPNAGRGGGYTRAAMLDAGPPAVAFVPEDIEVAAEVDARFLADVR
jgi:hypothetical protein